MKSVKSNKASTSKQAISFLSKINDDKSLLTFSGAKTKFATDGNEDNEIDEEILQYLRRLDKKDSITKQKALDKLLDLLPLKDKSIVAASLHMWTKCYSKLYLDENKTVRVKTQTLMQLYSQICGKLMAPYINKLLPIWILSQSDSHCDPAAIAKAAFDEAFPTKEKRYKAYMLFWNNESLKKELIDTFNKKSREIIISNIDDADELYIENLSVKLRTLLVILPYLKESKEENAFQDVINLLKTKSFWSHYKSNSPEVKKIYLNLFIELIKNSSGIIKEQKFIISNFADLLRNISNIDAYIIQYFWKFLQECILSFSDSLFNFISFKSAFIPQIKKIIQTGAEGQLYVILSEFIIVFKQLPFDYSKSINEDSEVLICLSSFLEGFNYAKLVNSPNNNLSCLAQSYFTLSVTSIMSALEVNNYQLIEKIVDLAFQLTENLIVDKKIIRIDNYWTFFVNYLIKPSISKQYYSADKIINNILAWTDSYFESNIFCEMLTVCLKQIQTSCINNEQTTSQVTEFKYKLFSMLSGKLLDKVLQNNQTDCLIPYLFILTENTENISECDDALLKCTAIIQKYSNTSTYSIICHGLAMIFNCCVRCGELYERFIVELTQEQKLVFFELFYQKFIQELKDEAFIGEIADKTLVIWRETIVKYIKQVVHEQDNAGFDIPKCFIDVIMKRLSEIDAHKNHNQLICNAIGQQIQAIIQTKVEITVEANEQLINLISQLIEHLKSISKLEVLSPDVIVDLMKMILCSEHQQNTSITPLSIYLTHCKEIYNSEHLIKNFQYLISELLCLNECCNFSMISCLLGAIILQDTTVARCLVEFISENLLLKDLREFEQNFSKQVRYSDKLTSSNQTALRKMLQKLCVLIILVSSHKHNQEIFGELIHRLNMSCFILNYILKSTYHSMYTSNSILEQCAIFDDYYQSNIVNNGLLIDEYLREYCHSDSQHAICELPALMESAILDTAGHQYVQWSESMRTQIDLALIDWSSNDLNDRLFSFYVNCLIPIAVRSRYAVQDQILAGLTCYLTSSTDSYSLLQINKTIILCKNLVKYDCDYFSVCMSRLMQLKPSFESYLDKLSCATKEVDNNVFQMSNLLEMLTAVVDKNLELISSQHWEFILCLVAALIRSDNLKSCIDRRQVPQDSTGDYLLDGYWLLKLIGCVSIGMVSISVDSIVDEWDNFFSESIFIELLDQFNVLNQRFDIGQIVVHPIFEFYQSALSECVGLCPITILTNYNFPMDMSADDPVELPRDFLAIYNYFLDALSNSNLVIEVAGYNCLLNLTETLRDHLNNWFNNKEQSQSIESFLLNLPARLTSYLHCDIDILKSDRLTWNEQVVVYRSLFSWNLIFHLMRLCPIKLRAEIAAYLTQEETNNNNGKLFDKFQYFCFNFMPKLPVINKSGVKFPFLSRDQRQLHMIADRPLIFDSPDRFVVQDTSHTRSMMLNHLACFTFRNSIQTLPSLTRKWWMGLNSKIDQQSVEEYVKNFISSELIKREFQQLNIEFPSNKGNARDVNKIEIKTTPLLGKITVKYNVTDEQSLKQTIQLPKNYPLGSVEWGFNHVLPNHGNRWRAMSIQLTVVMQNQNGTVADCVEIIRDNWDNYFNGVEECMICYSVLHQSKFTLPSMKCDQCRKKFHKDCMYTWFKNSPNPTCPNCRHLFFDGTYKRLGLTPDQ